MEAKPIKLSEFLLQQENLLQGWWRSSMKQLTGRLEGLSQNPGVFNEVRGLLMNLVAVVERSGSVEQAVDAGFTEILTHLKALQSGHQLSSTDMVFLLFSMRDAVREAV